MNCKPLLITLLTASAGVAPASETPVKITDLPPAVRQRVDKETKGATLRGLSRETEKRKVYYEAETTVDGRSRDNLAWAAFTIDIFGQKLHKRVHAILATYSRS